MRATGKSMQERLEKIASKLYGTPKIYEANMSKRQRFIDVGLHL